MFVTGKFLYSQYRNKEENTEGTEDLFLYRQIFVKSVFVRTIFDCTHKKGGTGKKARIKKRRAVAEGGEEENRGGVGEEGATSGNPPQSRTLTREMESKHELHS